MTASLRFSQSVSQWVGSRYPFPNHSQGKMYGTMLAPQYNGKSCQTL